MKNLRKLFILATILLMSSILIQNQVHAGGGSSKMSSDTKSPAIRRSPSYGDTILPLEEGCYTLPINYKSIIPHYCRSSGGKKTSEVMIPSDIIRSIDLAVNQFNRQLKDSSLSTISHEVFVAKDESYEESLCHLEAFFKGIQIETGVPSTVDVFPSPNRLSTRLSTTFKYADFISRIYKIMNSSELSPAQRLAALQMILTKLSGGSTPIYIFSPSHTDLILKLDPAKVDSVNTALVAEGSRIQNNVLLPGTTSILMKFSDKTQKKTEDLSILFFIR